MATQLLAAGPNAASSASFVLAAGESTNIFLKGEEGGTLAEMVAVEIQDDANGWTQIAMLGTALFGVNVAGPGTFRVRRLDGLQRNIGVSRG